MRIKIPLRKEILKKLVSKEFKQIFRDKRMMAILFIAPVVMLFVLGYAANTDVNEISLAVLDEDCTSESRKFLQIFTSGTYFRFGYYLESGREAAGLLDKGDIEVFIHIPANFSRNVKSGGKADIQIILDGADSNRAAVIVSYINQITNDFSLDYFKDRIRMQALSRQNGITRLRADINVQERPLFNPDLASKNFFLPGVLALLISVITIMLTSMAVVKEKESGTIEQIIVSPLRPVEYIIGKTLPFFIVAFFDICIVAMFVIFWFDVPFRGSFIFLLISGMIYIISALSVGLFISTVSKTQQEAMLSTFVYFMPAMLFSGFVFPVYAMPLPVRIITYINPIRYYISMIRGIFLKGIGITVLWPEMLVLIFMGAVLLILSVKRFARRME